MKICVNDFRNWMKNRNLKEATIRGYVFLFLSFDNQYQFFDQESVNKFLASKKNVHPKTRGFLMNLKKFLMANYKELGLTREKRIEISEVELPEFSGRPKQRLINPLSEEQVKQLENYLPTEERKLQLFMTYYGGLRIGELQKIKILSFNWEDWKKDMTQLGECRVYGKGDKEGIAFFPPWLMKRIAAYIRSRSFPSLSSYLFVKNSKDPNNTVLPIYMWGWHTDLRAAGVKSGITKLNEEGKIIEETKVNPHRLRHSWGAHLHNVKKLDIRDIQEILRHSSISSTQIYTHVDKSQLKKTLSNNVFSNCDSLSGEDSSQ